MAQDEQMPDWYELTEHGEVIMSLSLTIGTSDCAPNLLFSCARNWEEMRWPRPPFSTLRPASVSPMSYGCQVKHGQSVPRAKIFSKIPTWSWKCFRQGNRQTEINHKVQAYLASGIQEVIVVGLDGTITSHHAAGIAPTSTFGVVFSLPTHLFSLFRIFPPDVPLYQNTRLNQVFTISVDVHIQVYFMIVYDIEGPASRQNCEFFGFVNSSINTNTRSQPILSQPSQIPDCSLWVC